MYNSIQKKFNDIFKVLRGHGKITDSNISDTIRDIRRALLEADVNFRVVKEIINYISNKVQGQKVFSGITPGQQFIKIIHDEIFSFLSINNRGSRPLNQTSKKILLVGLQGTGKTTTAAKLAYYINNELNKETILIGADVNRPAAKKQLEKLSNKTSAEFYSDQSNIPLDIVKNGLEIASKKNKIAIIDTAGRTHINNVMMEEIHEINELIKPDEILYIVDSMSGQDAINSCISFSKIVPISGVILTKSDSDSRGGVALSVSFQLKKPILFMGNGENIKDLVIYDAKKITKQILGMSDIVELVENIKGNIDQDEAQKMKNKIMTNQFNFNDFKKQMDQIKKLGPMNDILKSIPGINQKIINSNNDKEMKCTESIIDSMTNHEREKPLIINASRKKRIASGSGRSIQDVNSLLKSFNSMKKMMKNKKLTSYFN